MYLLRDTIFAIAGWLTAVAVLSAQPPGFGPPGMQERKILKDHDANKDGWLNADERAVAREALKKNPGPGPKGPPKMGRFGGNGPETKPGPKVAVNDVKSYPTAALYDPTILRTIFITFESNDWEKELEEFHGTDVDVPAIVTVDGKTYPGVGVHFRGMSSYMMVRAGQKRSLNLSLDTVDSKQRLLGAKSLNLLNAHEDPTFLNTVLYSQLAREHIPTPKANLVKVVINGESWGIYTNVQQFDKIFLTENYQTTKGTRWKVRGSPGGGGGLEYLGEEVTAYAGRYEMKSGEDAKAWAALIRLCKTLNQTPPEKLEEALKPMLDMEGLLWFLAYDNALINCDGYWIRASDYSIYLDPKGIFHMVPHDMNECFRAAGGPGFGGGPGGGGPGGGKFPFPRPGEQPPPKKDGPPDGSFLPPIGGFPPPPEGGFGPPGMGGGRGGNSVGVKLDPLIGLTDLKKPLRSKILAVPSLKAKYLANVKEIAEKSLDWKKLGPIVAGYRTMLEAEIAADTRKLETTESFLRTTADAAAPATGREISLRAFADERRKYLLDYKEAKKAP